MLSRWQFGIVTTYHFLFVPLTIGLAFVIAIIESIGYARNDDKYRRLARFLGKLLLINFAVGVATGIVQEFQFGMNWSNYSRFVGDIFGAPLAMEGLLAFFFESTFLGLWWFGRDKLKPKVHLATIWCVSIGTILSAYFILAANSWMQNPVGFVMDETTGRPRMTNIAEVLFNKVQLVTFPHVLSAALVVVAFFLFAIAAWHLIHKRNQDIMRRLAVIGLIVGLFGSLGVSFTGSLQAQVMTEIQPMKIAAAEALWNTESNAGWSIFAAIDSAEGRNSFDIEIPNMLSILATNSPDGTVQGINNVQAQYEQEYGPGNYIPNVFVAYWTFRIMAYVGLLAAAFCIFGLVLLWRRKLEHFRWFLRFGVVAVVIPYFGTSAGWIFTEMGRQPWSVFTLLQTADSGSPSVGPATVWISLIGFILIYLALAVVDFGLLIRYAKKDLPEIEPLSEQGPAPPGDEAEDRVPELVY